MANYSYPNYTCGDFATHLHDDAEARGIRSGIVAVSLNTTGYSGLDTSHAVRANPGVANDSDYGHGFNVFNTTDKGFVYIDATGVTAGEKAQGRQPHYMVVYFEQGMPLGEIAVEQAESLNYSYYQQRERQYGAYELNLSAFNAEAQAYNDKILAFNNTSKALDRNRASFDEEYGRFSTEMNDLKDANVSKQDMPKQLEIWREGLADWLNALNIKLDKVQEQNKNLDAEKQLLDEKRATIEQSEESKWIMTEPLGVVDKIDVFW